MTAEPTADVLDWRTVFPARDRQIYEAGRFGEQMEFGTRPAILIIDVFESTAGRAGQDIMESIAENRTSVGGAGDSAIDAMATLIELGRRHGIPVVYVKGSVANKYHCGDSTKGTRPEEVAKLYGAPIVSRIAPLESEYVLEKTKASAFFASPLTVYLQRLGIDTLLICGTTTSGCVRASVIDAYSHGYQVFVVEDCVYDRSPMSHAVNLYEMNAKYASVMPLEALRVYIENITQETSTPTGANRV